MASEKEKEEKVKTDGDVSEVIYTSTVGLIMGSDNYQAGLKAIQISESTNVKICTFCINVMHFSPRQL
jgi:hypothetical protein